MRYLVVLPPTGPSDSARFHDLESGELAVGDQLLIDALQVRVRNVVHVPAQDGYDATLICTACD
jgi:hypothetical protein